MSKKFRDFDLDQPFLLPPDMRSWLAEGHLALFVADVVAELDLSAVFGSYGSAGGRGQPPHHPRMMVGLLVYGYCTGVVSSRKIEKACRENVAFRVLSGDQKPDHDTVAEFRRRHLDALSGLFVQVLQLCREAGLVKLGHVSVDGTKIEADASKHKAMSYARMVETEKKLQEEVGRLLAEAEGADAAEDAKHGKGKRGDELPDELARRGSRLAKIREAKAALEQQAREKTEFRAAEATARIEERRRREEETGEKAKGRDPIVPDPAQAVPEPKAQRNFTDPESRIMVDGASKAFEQCYNGQIAVDAESQIIVAAEVVQDANDKKQLVPVLEQVKENTGRMPEKASADSGYFSEAAVNDPTLKDVDLYVATGRQKHGEPAATGDGPAPDGPRDDGPGGASAAAAGNAEAATAGAAAAAATATANGASKPRMTKEAMRAKLKTAEGEAVYKRRKAVVEPVFGQIKGARGFRRFSFRGLQKVRREWKLVCLTHNLLKLFRRAAAKRSA